MIELKLLNETRTEASSIVKQSDLTMTVAFLVGALQEAINSGQTVIIEVTVNPSESANEPTRSVGQ